MRIVIMRCFILAIIMFCSLIQAPAQGVSHQVFVMYYPWYGGTNSHGSGLHWGKVHSHSIQNTTDYPVIGPYNSRDPNLINWQIDLAKSNGITGFISSWWGQHSYEDRAFKTVLDCAEKKNFTAAIYWEKEDGHGQEQIDGAVSDLAYMVTNYGSSPAYLKVNGRPVIFIYERVLAQIPESAWPAIISETRAEVGNFLLIADGPKTNYARMFDGLHRYNISWGVAKYTKMDDLSGLRDFFAQYDSNMVQQAHQYGHIACVPVTPGYNDTKIRKPGRLADRKDGQVYRILWEDALAAKPDWVLITSWNEWHEGTEIEPSVEYGNQYIDLTAQYAQPFLQSSANAPSVGNEK